MQQIATTVAIAVVVVAAAEKAAQRTYLTFVPSNKTIRFYSVQKLVYIEALKLIDNLNCSTDIITIWCFYCTANFKLYILNAVQHTKQ